MGDLPERGTEAALHERAIAALIERTTLSAEDVRSLYAGELARLETNAKVRTHLVALATSNVRGILRRTSAVSRTGLMQRQRANTPTQ